MSIADQKGHPSQSNKRRERDQEEFKVFIGNVSRIAEGILQQIICSVVPETALIRCYIPHKDGRALSYGFAAFSDMSYAEIVVKKLHKTVIDGRAVSVELSHSTSKSPAKRKKRYENENTHICSGRQKEIMEGRDSHKSGEKFMECAQTSSENPHEKPSQATHTSASPPSPIARCSPPPSNHFPSPSHLPSPSKRSSSPSLFTLSPFTTPCSRSLSPPPPSRSPSPLPCSRSPSLPHLNRSPSPPPSNRSPSPPPSNRSPLHTHRLPFYRSPSPPPSARRSCPHRTPSPPPSYRSPSPPPSRCNPSPPPSRCNSSPNPSICNPSPPSFSPLHLSSPLSSNTTLSPTTNQTTSQTTSQTNSTNQTTSQTTNFTKPQNSNSTSQILLQNGMFQQTETSVDVSSHVPLRLFGKNVLWRE